MEWPQGVATVLNMLDRAGYEAWAVGGCVRDFLMGRTPHDWDVCTSATPDAMRQALAGLRLIDTGAAHGTLTALTPMPVEVTTYRVDGAYADHRRPQDVRFVRRLDQDLMRRDFTINAMALRPDRPLVDLFGGQADLQSRLVRCVGDARQRFEEDALRMLRCLRFAAQLDFAIEDGTAWALRQGWAQLHYVSAERIGGEYLRLIVGPGAGRVLDAFRGQLEALTPFARADLTRADLLPPDPVARLGYLIESSSCLKALRLDNRTCAQVSALCRLRATDPPSTRYGTLKLLGDIGAPLARTLLDIWDARGLDVAGARALMDGALARGDCYRLGDLAVNGGDLTALGLKGAQVGRALDELLDLVMAGELPNHRDALLHWVQAR